MQIETKEIEKCKYEVVCTADAKEISSKKDEVIKLFKNAKVPGFRKGKVTESAIRIHYAKQINESAKKALAEDAYHNTLFEKGIRPYGSPNFKSASILDGKFDCKFELNAKPDFDLVDWKGLNIPKPESKYSSSDLTNKMLQELRVKHGDVKPFEDEQTVNYGDNVIIDYEAFLDGQDTPELSGQAQSFTVGKDNLSDIDNGLIGMKNGENKEFQITVPLTEQSPLAGKSLLFKAKLIIGSTTTPHPLNEDLSKKFGKETVDELIAELNKISSEKIVSSEKKAIANSIFLQLVESNTIDIPQWMVGPELQYLVYQSKIDWASLSEEERMKWNSTAQNNVKAALILDRIREDDPTSALSEEESFNIIKRHLTNTQDKDNIDQKIKEMNDSGYLQVLLARVQDEYTLDHVMKFANIIA